MVKTAKCHRNVHNWGRAGTVTAAARINTPLFTAASCLLVNSSSLILPLDLCSTVPGAYSLPQD